MQTINEKEGTRGIRYKEVQAKGELFGHWQVADLCALNIGVILKVVSKRRIRKRTKQGGGGRSR